MGFHYLLILPVYLLIILDFSQILNGNEIIFYQTGKGTPSRSVTAFEMKTFADENDIHIYKKESRPNCELVVSGPSCLSGVVVPRSQR